MATESTNTKQIGVRVSMKTYKILEKIAGEMGISTTTFAKNILEFFAEDALKEDKEEEYPVDRS